MNVNRDQSIHLSLTILFFVYLFNFLDRQIIAILAEPIARDLDLSDLQIGLMTGLSFALFYTILGFPIARYADRPGTNRVSIISLAVAIWSLMTVLCGLVHNATQMMLARVGVGVGEAGCTPPAHSLIADIVPPEKRASAMSIYHMGPPLGGLLGMVIGGILSDYLGWRWAFIIVGLPGIALALIVKIMLRDPRCDVKQKISSHGAPKISIRMSYAQIMGSQAMKKLLGVAGIAAFSTYGILIWATIFYQRSHDLSVTQTGIWLGLVSGLASALGVWLGGYLGDRQHATDKGRLMIVPSIALALSTPLMLAAFVVADWRLSMVLLFPAIVFNWLYLAPFYSTVQGLVSPSARAIASATVLFVQNFIGLGLGPVVLGFFSDVLKPEFGNESVRYVLFIASSASAAGAFLLWSSGRFLRTELDRYR